MRYSISLLFVFSINLLFGQQDLYIEKIAAHHLGENQKKWSLTDDDVSNFTISSYHTSKQSGVTHIYVNQDIDGISIHNAMAVINVKKDNSLLIASSDFIPNAKSKISNKKQASLTPQDAIHKYCEHHDLAINQTIKKKNIPTTISNEYIFEETSFSEGNLYATLLYFPKDNNELALTWRIEINEKKSPDYWVSFVDAHSGEIIHSDNQTTYCQFHKHSDANQHTPECTHNHEAQPTVNKQQSKVTTTVADGSSYLVYALPLEDPLDGEQTVLTEPFLPEASPMGWHDVDGFEGADFTITRGNNAHAFQNTSGTRVSQNDEPDGGQSLTFNFEHDKLGEPIESVDSDVTQLFYITNWMHDFSYFFGFDEVAGNYQENNFGRNGTDGDFVISRTLENQIVDGVTMTNNAFFSGPRDGINGVMGMLPFVSPGESVLNLLSPEEKTYQHGQAFFGIPDVTRVVSGSLVISIDSGGVSELNACDSIINAADLAGNVALVERGECDFSFKVNNLQNAGAIAVIICNRDEEIVNLGGGENEQLVTIPSAHLRKSDCDTLKTFIAQNMEPNIEFVFNLPTPAQLSSAFDNSVTVHEYAHGITLRLSGGRNAAGCLNAEEQMGEGWSDFFALVATQKPNDRAEDPRGIGVYINRAPDGVSGIRRQPYSTDFSVNNQTYNDIRFTGFNSTGPQRRGEHEVGEIWSAALWDMYWGFIDVYGYNEDWTDRNSGNARALQLIFDGLKIQPCNPGLVEGRDAILAADEALFSGENQCIIWDVFARRGIGFDAVQGLASDREDNQEGFLTAPACQNQLVITKNANNVIRVGDPIDVELVIENNTGTALTNVVVSDVVPEGTTPVGLDEFTSQFNESAGEITFDVSEMQPLDVVRINYQLATSTEITSVLLESVNTSIQNFNPRSIAGTESWNLIGDPDLGIVWNIPAEIGMSFDQALEFGSTISVSGEQPSVMFNHNFETELFFAAGDVEISTNNGDDWTSVRRDQILTGSFTDDVFFKNRDEFAFTGESEDLVQTTIDLSDYIGQDILIRFRFISFVTDGVAAQTRAKDGWTIAGLEFIDLIDYDLNEACVTSDQLPTECDGAFTIIESGGTTSSNEVLKEEFGFKLYPNPATNLVELTVQDIDVPRSIIRLSRIDGALISSEPLLNYGNIENFSIPLPSVPNGLYIMELQSPEGKISEVLSIIQE